MNFVSVFAENVFVLFALSPCQNIIFFLLTCRAAESHKKVAQNNQVYKLSAVVRKQSLKWVFMF